MSIDITYKKNNYNEWVVDLSGELDVSASDKLKEELKQMLDIEVLNIKIDISELEYIDSTGLGVLIGILKRAKIEEKEVEIINPRKNVLKIFTITGLNKIFKMEG